MEIKFIQKTSSLEMYFQPAEAPRILTWLEKATVVTNLGRGPATELKNVLEDIIEERDYIKITLNAELLKFSISLMEIYIREQRNNNTENLEAETILNTMLSQTATKH